MKRKQLLVSKQKLGEDMHIGIIGAGSVGLLLTAYLASHHQVTLYVKRPSQRMQIREEQIHLQVNGQDRKTIAVQVEDITNLQDHDLVFLAVKQPQLGSLLPYLQQLQEKTTVVFLQNGMAHLAYASSLENRVLLGVVEHGASRINDVTVNHLGQGKIVLGSLKNEDAFLQELVTKINQADFPFEYRPDVEFVLKEKLLVNAVINPLTALFNVPNGAIIKNDNLKILAQHICDEVATVLALDKQKSWDKVVAIANNTKNNTSSMRADILLNRSTEIEAIIGYILAESKEALPYTKFVYHSILAKSN